MCVKYKTCLKKEKKEFTYLPRVEKELPLLLTVQRKLKEFGGIS